MRRHAAFMALVAVLAAGCASTNAAPAFRDAASTVEARTGKTLRWRTDSEEDRQADAAIRDLLSKELTPDAAVQVALLNHRGLQATYEELGIAQADLVQAGLLQNPTLSGVYHFPLGNAVGPSFSFGVVENFLNLFTLAAKKRVARAQVENVELRVGDAVLRHVLEVKLAYQAVQAAAQTLAMRKVVADAGQAAMELADRLRQAQNINDLDYANEEAQYQQLALDVERATLDLASAREGLNRAMGVWGPDTAWTLSAKLADMPKDALTMDELESLAVARRLDLAAAHKDVEVVMRGLSLVKSTRWIGSAAVGVEYDREQEGASLVGPSLSVDLPLFDQGQAGIARIEAQLRMARAREYELAVDVRSEVREREARLTVARAIVTRYSASIVPVREQIVRLSQQQYNGMLIGVFQLLVAKQAEVNAYRDLISALRDYWQAYAELEWAVGGSLVPSAKGGTP